MTISILWLPGFSCVVPTVGEVCVEMFRGIPCRSFTSVPEPSVARSAGFHHKMESVLGSNVFIRAWPNTTTVAKQTAAAHRSAGLHSHGISQLVGIVRTCFSDCSSKSLKIKGEFVKFVFPLPDFRSRLRRYAS